MSVWFITGASRGFGRELATSALAHGDQVVATARDPQAVVEAFPEAGDALLAARLDVTDQEQASAAVAAAVERFGRIDVLVNNAGYALFGAIEEISDAEARALFDTNVFGLLNVTRAALPTLRGQGAGRILNMSSSAGFASTAGLGLYSATKFAVEGITEALHAELAPLGIQVTVVEPGAFRTEFLSADSRRLAEDLGIPAYTDTVGQLLEFVEAGNGHQPGDLAKTATAIRQLAAAEQPLRVQLGSDCVTQLEGKLDSAAKELDQWRDLSLSTNLDESE